MRFWAAFILVAIASLYYLHNQETDKPITTELAGVAMTMPYRVVIGEALNDQQQRHIQELITEVFNEVDSLYNQFNPKSEVSRLNNLRAGDSTILSSQMQSFLILVDSLVTMTNGRFDPTIAPLKKTWMPYLTKGTVPPEAEIMALHPIVGWSHIHFNEELFSKDHDDVMLNLDAVAKGYGVDLLVQRISQAGYASLFVEWGGEVKAIGQHPEGRLWRIYISGLESSKAHDALAYVDLDNAALATSGDYYQNWTVGDTVYCHVFDPQRLKPLEVVPGSVASASVLSSSCAAADALATASMVFDSITEAQAWAADIQQNYPSIHFWLVTR